MPECRVDSILRVLSLDLGDDYIECLGMYDTFDVHVPCIDTLQVASTS